MLFEQEEASWRVDGSFQWIGVLIVGEGISWGKLFFLASLSDKIRFWFVMWWRRCSRGLESKFINIFQVYKKEAFKSFFPFSRCNCICLVDSCSRWIASPNDKSFHDTHIFNGRKISTDCKLLSKTKGHGSLCCKKITFVDIPWYWNDFRWCQNSLGLVSMLC